MTAGLKIHTSRVQVNTRSWSRSRYLLVILAIALVLVLIVTAVNIAVPVFALLVLAAVFLHLPPPWRSLHCLQFTAFPSPSRAPPSLVV